MKRRILLTAFLVIVVLAACYLYYGVLYKEGRNVNTEAPAFTLQADEIYAQYELNAANADAEYLNKTIEVKGEITEAQTHIIILSPGVSCSFDNPTDKMSLGSKVTVKGRCLGYDELFGQVKIDQCSIIKHN